MRRIVAKAKCNELHNKNNQRIKYQEVQKTGDSKQFMRIERPEVLIRISATRLEGIKKEKSEIKSFQ